jgi:hypothetical protein
MMHRLWRLACRLHEKHPKPWTWNLRCATLDLAQWERGVYTWKNLLLNLPTWFGVFEEDL